MSTPICDFVREYAKKSPVRMHMPGHKGKSILGAEALDITEISGADELFAPNGIIAQSEKNAGEAFGCDTFYSAAGSTLCIQAMLYLIAAFYKKSGKRVKILAGRNAHKSFVNAAALLDIDVVWLFSENYYNCNVSIDSFKKALQQHQPDAVYITSPDYLGNMLDVRAISQICRQNKTLLAVDNAHGAYLRFLPESLFPIDLGADICCDSAHKTLPVLTGGAYLHVSPAAPAFFSENAKHAFAIFASSSPSYLILQSLDSMNDRFNDFKDDIAQMLQKNDLKAMLAERGIEFVSDEPLKLTLKPKSYGYLGEELAKILESKGIFPEFYDPDYVVLMLSPQHTQQEKNRLTLELSSLQKKKKITIAPPTLDPLEQVISPREALFMQSETVSLQKACNRICAVPLIGCPPAIPIAVWGERLNKNSIECMKYYGITECSVIK